jgi:hypothetical protein
MYRERLLLKSRLESSGLSPERADKISSAWIEAQKNTRFRELRYGINPAMPTGMQESLKMVDAVSGGDGLAGVMASLSGMGKITSEAGRAALNAEGGIGDWGKKTASDIMNTNIMQGVKEDYAAQFANAQQMGRGPVVDVATEKALVIQTNQLIALNAIVTALNSGIVARAR